MGYIWGYEKKMKDKFVRKYMVLAKTVGLVENPCFSRQIGSIIVNPKTNSIISTGYNGPPKGVPHCDTEWHIDNIVWDNLSFQEKSAIVGIHYLTFEEFLDTKRSIYGNVNLEQMKKEYEQLKKEDHLRKRIYKSNVFKHKCPRRVLNIPSGQRPELCSCEHSERNAIYNAQSSTNNCIIFCYCALPCFDCSKAIINSGIKKIYCLKSTEPDYSPQSRPILQKAGVEIVEKYLEEYKV